MFMCSPFANAELTVPVLINNADEAIAKVKSLTSGNAEGKGLSKRMAGLEDARIISALKSYEQYLSQAFSRIQSLRSKGISVTRSINALRTSDRKNLDILDGLQKKTNLSQPVKDAIGVTISKVKEIQKKLQALQNTGNKKERK